jgi:Cdc6-like AAA superfamily ATPase
MNDAKHILGSTIVPHTAFVEAQKQLELCFKYAIDKREAEGLAITGESGTGKTSVLSEFAALHPSTRSKSGMEVPILRATVPSGPTVKSLAGVMLAALHDTDSEWGTENEKSSRLRVLMKNTGTRMVMIDEFQHFHDRGKRRIMHHVADWLKVLIDDTKTTLIVAGLPRCLDVIGGNEQLDRRFLAPIQLPRFSWTDPEQREEFLGILGTFNEEIGKSYDLPIMDTDEMAFRFFCATGGLIGLLTKLLRQAIRTADTENTRKICLEDLNAAHKRAMASRPLEPFARGFQPVLTRDTLDIVSTIGRTVETELTYPRRAGKARRTESAHSMLVAS